MNILLYEDEMYSGRNAFVVVVLCSHSPNDVPPEPQRNVSIAAVRGAVRPSIGMRSKLRTPYIVQVRCLLITPKLIVLSIIDDRMSLINR